MDIASLFKEFHQKFPYLDIDSLVEYFSCFGGIEDRVEFDFFETLEDSIKRVCLLQYQETKEFIEPSFLLEEPYRSVAISIARGDGKIFNIFKRAKINESDGGSIIRVLEEEGVIFIQDSREEPIDRDKIPILPKELRGYRIQPKVRFLYPFYRFWFGFIEPFRRDILANRFDRVLLNYQEHKDRVESFLFERLSDALLKRYLLDRGEKIISSGSLWDRVSEFDIFSITASGKVILGECKFKSRRVCASELSKLKEKAKNSSLSPDIYVLFSFEGFSKELKDRDDDSLLLFEKEDFKRLWE